MPVSLRLERLAYLRQCTVGRLELPSGPIYTLERPWLPNPAGPGGTLRESCIPDGRYVVRPHSSERFPGTYALTNEEFGVYYQQRPAGQAWGRTAILIHKANTVGDVIGCVGVGIEYVIYSDRVALVRSADALELLRAALPRSERHELIVAPCRGTA